MTKTKLPNSINPTILRKHFPLFNNQKVSKKSLEGFEHIPHIKLINMDLQMPSKETYQIQTPTSQSNQTYLDDTNHRHDDCHLPSSRLRCLVVF